MRLAKTISAALLAIALTCACGKDEGSMLEEAVEYTISSTDTLRHSIGYFGDEEGASIHSQAINFRISELVRDNTDEIIYHYVADSAFVGIDRVVLRSARGSDGESPSNDIVITNMEIIVE